MSIAPISSTTKSVTPIGGPFAHGRGGISRTMVLVMAALTPATLWGLYLYGWPAINLFAVTVASAVGFEAMCLWILGRPVARTLADGSAVLTGWLLALTLPPWAPGWVGIVGSMIAIVIAKQIFGGLGQNPFNPAMVARVALLISFPLELTTFVSPLPLLSPGAPGVIEGLHITLGMVPIADAVTSASVLGHLKTEAGMGTAFAEALKGLPSSTDLALGREAGSLGETSAVLLLAGGLVLLATRVIRWPIPVAMLAGIALPAVLMHAVDPVRYPDVTVHLLSGAAVLGAFFIATDLVTSPVTARGQLVFGFGCGVLAYVIRSWAGYPEGVAFAVLLMNAAAPLIDRYMRPRIMGRTAKGEPRRV